MFAKTFRSLLQFSCLLLLATINTAFATPNIQTWQTNSGAKVMFVEDHNIAMLDTAVSFAAGSAFDTPEKSGVAALTHHLLELGAGELTEDDIDRQIADLGARLSGGFDQDIATKSLRTLSKADVRNKALAILATVIQKPIFSDEVLTREKARLIASLKEAETKPDAIADKLLQKAVFGAHPYAMLTTGEINTVEQITVDDLKHFYQSFYQAKNAVIAIMGDVTRVEAEAMAEQLSANLPDGEFNIALPEVKIEIAAQEERIAHPATQSHILIGALGVARGDPDYFPLFVGNYVLGGGGFVSRLMNEVREKRGMAYSVYSYFMPMKQPGLFQLGLQTKKEQADEALAVVRETLASFIKEGPSEQELEAAKQNLIGGFPLRVDSNSKILGYLTVIGFYNLPLDYLNQFTHNIEQVTTKGIKDAFARHINPDAMATIIVGAPEAKVQEEVK